MNMINRWQMELAKMIVVVGCVCCTCQLASAYQLQVFALGSDFAENATAELLPFDESGAQLTRFGIPESGVFTTSFATDGESFFVAANRSGY